MTRPTKHGFTLIELSIVIIIIGLIIGGVLIGRDLIRAAEIRTVISDVDKFKSVINAFKLKYNCIPGDCSNASSFLTGTSNGNGDERIASFPVGAGYGEVWQVWYQLAAANLIGGTYTGTQGTGGTRHAVPGINVPTSKLGPTIGYTLLYWGTYTDSNDWSPCIWCKFNTHILMLGTTHTIHETYFSAISPQTAYTIDSKIDDGLPGAGKIIHSAPTFLPGCTSNNNPATSTYVLTATTTPCNLFFTKFF